MKAVITTSYAVLLLESTTGNVRIMHSGEGVYYGITRRGENIIVASRRRLVDAKSDQPDDKGCLLSFSVCTRETEVYSPDFPFRDLHGIDAIGKDIYCCCSFDNAIGIYRESGSKFWTPLGRPASQPYDFNHINTITHDSSSIYILAHNWGRGSELYTISRETHKIHDVLQIGHQAHSIWFDDGQLRVLSSAEGKVVGPDGLSVFVGGFPRGYASDGTHRIIGISENVLRSRRDQSHASVIVCDADYNIVRSVDLGKFGMVLDIMEITDDEYYGLLPLQAELV